MKRKSISEARATLASLVAAAKRGEATIIMQHGEPVAAIVPPDRASPKAMSLAPLIGSGRGLWGHDVAKYVRELRDEWSR